MNAGTLTMSATGVICIVLLGGCMNLDRTAKGCFNGLTMNLGTLTGMTALSQSTQEKGTEAPPQ